MTQWRYIHYLTTAFLIVVLCPLSGLADDGDGDAGQPGEFLYYGTSIRAMAMGRAYVGLTDDAASVFHNPAGLMENHRPWDLYFMHYQPFYVGHANILAASAMRLDTTATGLGEFLFGHHSAWGLGIISFGSEDYEYRTIADEFLGTFDMYQQALYVSFARRDMINLMHRRLAFKLNYGISIKTIRQGFTNITGFDSDYGTGVDLGVQLQFIHTWPVTNLVPLRWLLPLRLGASVQNLGLRPKVGMGAGGTDTFPTIYRFGFSYLIGDVSKNSVLLAGDAVKQAWNDRGWGLHGGVEGRIPVQDVLLFLRAGAYRQSDDWRLTAGWGIDVDITEKLNVSLDYAHEFREDLSDDQRISLHLHYGLGYDAEHLHKAAIEASSDRGELGYTHALEALSCYPYLNAGDRCDANSSVIKSAKLLADTLDPTIEEEYTRYSDFIGGSFRILQLLRMAQKHLRICDYNKASGYAREALRMLGKDKLCPENTNNEIIASIHLVLAEAEPENAGQHASHADVQLVGPQSPNALYLKGRCKQLLGLYIDAEVNYGKAMNRLQGKRKSDLYKLALIGKAAAIVAGSQSFSDRDIETLIETLDTDLNSFKKGQLSATYLPYPVYRDFTVADNSQVLIGRLYEKLAETDPGRRQDAARAYARLLGIYYKLDAAGDSAFDVNERLEQLIERMEEDK